MARGQAVECDECGDVEFYYDDLPPRRMDVYAVKGWINIFGDGNSLGESIDVCSLGCFRRLVSPNEEDE